MKKLKSYGLVIMSLSLSSRVERTAHDEGQYRAEVEMFKNMYLFLYRNGVDMSEQMMLLKQKCETVFQENYLSHYHITISFPPEFKDYDVMKKVVAKKWMFEWQYTWEFHGKTGEHPHVHLVCRKTKRKSEVIREIYNTLKNYLSDPQKIDVRAKARKDFDPSYIAKDNPKDIPWRKSQKLKDLYSYDGGTVLRFEGQEISHSIYGEKREKLKYQKIKINTE